MNIQGSIQKFFEGGGFEIFGMDGVFGFFHKKTLAN